MASSSSSWPQAAADADHIPESLFNLDRCYIGYKELKLAMERTREEHPDTQFQLEYRPFLLDPTLSCRQPVDKVSIAASSTHSDSDYHLTSAIYSSKNEHLTKKFGEMRYKTACKFLEQRGSELGIKL